MPLDTLDFRTSLQKLIIALIVILVPLTICGFYFAIQGGGHVRQASGENLSSVTRIAAGSTSDYIADCVRDVSLIANSPESLQSVTAANRKYERLSEEAVLAKISDIDQQWESSQKDALAMSILTSDLARQIRRMRDLHPTLLKIAIFDVAGSTVAATDRPAHYFQIDREFWRAVSAGGRGAIRVSDLRYDDQSRLYYLSIGYPILREGTGQFIGAVTATIDMSRLFGQLNRYQIGRTGRLFLVKDDGKVIEAAGVTPSMRIQSEEYGAIRDALGSLRGREAGYIYATLSNGESYLIGFADVGLKDAYPTLPWMILASQETREILGPVRSMVGFALVMMVLALLMLSLLAAYAFLHRKQELEDIAAPEDRARAAAA